ncbi:MAG: LCP family protein [Acidimicrobiales bacterium]
MDHGNERPAPAHVRRRRRIKVIPKWPRRVLVGVNIVVAVLVLGAGAVYGYARYELGRVRTGSGLGLARGEGHADRSQAYAGLPAENILLIGNETRAGQTAVNFGNPALLSGTLADVIMILHLDPRTRTASILSIPRDLLAPMPAGSPVGSPQKIDAALNDGKLGPNNLVAAIHQDFGITINHYVEVDFDGFLQTVNALGGIRLNFPERLYDAYSGLNINHTGCQLIHGQQALALVRSRHLQYDPPGVSPYDTYAWPYDPESDLARIVRDHIFIRVLAKTAERQGIGNPFKASAFVSAALNQLTIDPGLKAQLVTLIERYHSVNPGSAPARTFPVTFVNGAGNAGYVFAGANKGDVEFPDEPADLATIRAWDPGSLPVPVRPTAVTVTNISGVAAVATTTAAGLAADGFHVTSQVVGTVPASQSETVVQYRPGQLAEGFDVLEHLSGAVVLQSTAGVPAGTVDVQAGSTLAVIPAHRTTPTSTVPPTSVGASGSSATTTPTTTVPTPGGQAPSASKDQLTPYDPRPC